MGQQRWSSQKRRQAPRPRRWSHQGRQQTPCPRPWRRQRRNLRPCNEQGRPAAPAPQWMPQEPAHRAAAKRPHVPRAQARALPPPEQAPPRGAAARPME
eukprot:10138354-Alexandrium_andersonii.AAC.1